MAPISCDVRSAASRTSPMRARISPVALEVWSARLFTSCATTAKPRPASPARAASIVAFSAKRLVCLATEEIRSTISLMRPTACVSWLTAVWVVSARSVASRATLAEAEAWRSTSEMVAPSSSEAAATVLMESRTLKIELTAEWARVVFSDDVEVRIDADCSRWLDAFSTPRMRPAKSRLNVLIRDSICAARSRRARPASSCSALND